MINRNFIIEKMNLISAGLDQLRGFSQMTFAEVAGDYIKYSALKNILMETIGRAIDINQHLIADAAPKKFDAPRTYRDGFLKLGELGILPQDFARKIAQSAGFRNAIVHEYNNLDKGEVYKTVGEAIAQYKEYCAHIAKYIDEKREF